MIINCEYCNHAFDTYEHEECPNCGAKYETKETPKVDYQKEMEDFAKGLEQEDKQRQQKEMLKRIIKIALWCILGVIIVRFVIAVIVTVFAFFFSYSLYF